MSFLVVPFVTAGLQTVISVGLNATGSVLWYTGKGIWWLGRRAVYGYEPSEAERISETLAQQTELIKRQTELIEQLQSTQASLSNP